MNVVMRVIINNRKVSDLKEQLLRERLSKK